MQSLDGSRGRVDRSSHTDDLDALIQLAELHTDAATFGDWLADQLQARPAAERARSSTCRPSTGSRASSGPTSWSTRPRPGSSRTAWPTTSRRSAGSSTWR